jgi:hypothetical protein
MSVSMIGLVTAKSVFQVHAATLRTICIMHGVLPVRERAVKLTRPQAAPDPVYGRDAGNRREVSTPVGGEDRLLALEVVGLLPCSPHPRFRAAHPSGKSAMVARYNLADVAGLRNPGRSASLISGMRSRPGSSSERGSAPARVGRAPAAGGFPCRVKNSCQIVERGSVEHHHRV